MPTHAAPNADDAGNTKSPNDDASAADPSKPSKLGSFVFAPVQDQTAGTPFEVSVTALAVNGHVMNNYSGSPALGGNLGSPSSGCDSPATCDPLYGALSEFDKGVARASITAFGAQELRFLTVTDGDVFSTSDLFEVRPADVSVTNSEVGVTPSELPADGKSTATITVRLKDAFGNDRLVSQDEIAVKSSGAGTLSGLADNGDGSHSATLTAPKNAGQATLTVMVGSDVLADVAVMTFVAVGPPPAEAPKEAAVVPAIVTSTGGEKIVQTATSSAAAAPTTTQPVRTTISAWADFTDPSITSAALAVDVKDQAPALASDFAGPGYSILGLQQQLTIAKTIDGEESRAEATPENPFVVEFWLDPSLVPSSTPLADLLVYREGKLVRNCEVSGSYVAPSAAADPCIADRTRRSDGAVLTVHVIAASQWNFFIADEKPTPAVDPEPTQEQDPVIEQNPVTEQDPVTEQNPSGPVSVTGPYPPAGPPSIDPVAPVVPQPMPSLSPLPEGNEAGEEGAAPKDPQSGVSEDGTSGSPEEPLKGPRVRWSVAHIAALHGGTIQLRVYLGRCDGNEYSKIALYRVKKGKKVKVLGQMLDSRCRATFTVPAGHNTRYKAMWRSQNEDFRSGRSSTLRIRRR